MGPQDGVSFGSLEKLVEYLVSEAFVASVMGVSSRSGAYSGNFPPDKEVM